jgi:hypothetical protein
MGVVDGPRGARGTGVLHHCSMRRLRLLAALLLAASCGSRTPSSTPVLTPPTAPVAAGATAPEPTEDADPGLRIAERGATLPDGTVVGVEVADGDAELVGDRWVVYRESSQQLRVRPVAPRTSPLSIAGVALALGDRATTGDWEIQWVAVRDGQVLFRARHREQVVDEWKAELDLRPTHEIAAARRLLHFELTMTAVRGELARPGASVTVTGGSVERASGAKFGRALKPGFYVFPDGLRLRVERIASCDFDTSVPCFGGTYRAEALLGEEEASTEWSTRATKLLRYTLTLSNFELIVRK